MNTSSDTSCCVIIPTYNGEKFIGDTLESVFRQKLVPAEVIVVDDGSADGTLDIVSRFKGLKLYQNRENSGPGVSRKFALEQTIAPLVAFLDQDDVWHPLHLNILHDAIITYPDSPAVVSKQSNFRIEENPVFDVKTRHSTWFDAWDTFPLFNRISTPSGVLINRNILKRTGGWAPQYTGAADYHLWLRLCTHHPLRLLDSVTVGRRAHRNSLVNISKNKSELKYMNLRYRACKNALRYLISNFSGNDKNKIQSARQSMRYYQNICLFVESIINNNHAEIPGLVERIADFIESCPDRKNMNIFLFLYYGFPKYRNKLLLPLYTNWPKRLAGARDELQKEMPLFVIKKEKAAS